MNNNGFPLSVKANFRAFTMEYFEDTCQFQDLSCLLNCMETLPNINSLWHENAECRLS